MTTATRTDVESPAFAVRMLEKYETARETLYGAQETLGGVKEGLSAGRSALGAIEASVMVNGGVGEVYINGANESQRKAQLALALNHSPEYQDAARKVREGERLQYRCENDIDAALNDMRYARLALEYASSWNKRLAAEESGFARRNGNG